MAQVIGVSHWYGFHSHLGALILHGNFPANAVQFKEYISGPVRVQFALAQIFYDKCFSVFYLHTVCLPLGKSVKIHMAAQAGDITVFSAAL